MKASLLSTLTAIALTLCSSTSLHAADEQAQATSLTMASDVWQPLHR